MSVDPYYYARYHDGGPGSWCVRGPGGFEMVKVGLQKGEAYVIGKTLSKQYRDAIGMLKSLASIYGEPRNEFPKLGINTAELAAEVDRLIELARQEPDMGAVNWGDIGITDIQYRLSMMHHEDAPSCVVTIEEADPGCALAAWINARLDKDKFPRTYVECEW